MSDIVIRHAEPRDAEPLRMLMAHPEVYHDTLQIPYPSMEAWQEKLQPRPHTFHLVATLDEQVAGHLSLHVEPRPRRSHVATFGMAVAARPSGLRHRQRADARDDRPVRQLAARRAY